MSEEMNKRAPELNDAALEGVSGGLDKLNVIYRQREVCEDCRSNRGDRSCGGSSSELIEYMHEHGIIHKFENCPFLKSKN